jgi:hypothetical protein
MTSCLAQNNKFGLSAGIGSGAIIKKPLDGDATYKLNTGFSVGLQYERKIKESLYVQTGLNWYKNSVNVTPSFYPGNDISAKSYDISLLTLPIFVRVEVSKYIYLNGGLLTDFDISNNKYLANQSGIGAGIGIGTELLQSHKMSLRINPFLNFHSLILFEKETYPERIFDAGIQLSIMIK